MDCVWEKTADGIRCKDCGWVYPRAYDGDLPRLHRNCPAKRDPNSPQPAAQQPAMSDEDMRQAEAGAERLGWSFSDAKHYAAALVKWSKAGFPTRSDADVARCEEVCKGCEHYRQGRCAKCGCRVNQGPAVSNKIRMGTENCPLDKWAPALKKSRPLLSNMLGGLKSASSRLIFPAPHLWIPSMGMANIMFRNNKILFTSEGKIAFGSGCCCEEQEPAAQCDNCTTGTTPSAIVITVSGVASGGLCAPGNTDTCDEANGTFVCPQRPPPWPPCSYMYYGSVCNETYNLHRIEVGVMIGSDSYVRAGTTSYCVPGGYTGCASIYGVYDSGAAFQKWIQSESNCMTDILGSMQRLPPGDPCMCDVSGAAAVIEDAY